MFRKADETKYCIFFVQELGIGRFIIYLSISDFDAFSGLILIEISSGFFVLS